MLSGLFFLLTHFTPPYILARLSSVLCPPLSLLTLSSLLLKAPWLLLVGLLHYVLLTVVRPVREHYISLELCVYYAAVKAWLASLSQ